MNDLQSMMAASAWREMIERRRRRNRIRGIALISFGAMVLGLIGLGAANLDRIARWPVLTIHDVAISSNRVLERHDVLDLLGLQPGDPWWRYDPSAIHRRVEKIPRIAEFNVRYAWFHELRVDVQEREPILLVLGDPDGELTQDGWLLETRGVGGASDLPVLRLASGAPPQLGKRVGTRAASVARLLGKLRRDRPDLVQRISEVELVADHARVYFRTGRKVVLYRPGSNEELWRQIPSILEDLKRRGRGDVVLDLRFAERIIVHLPVDAVTDTLDAPNPLDRV
jgi:cell division septal protein FtsQ